MPEENKSKENISLSLLTEEEATREYRAPREKLKYDSEYGDRRKEQTIFALGNNTITVGEKSTNISRANTYVKLNDSDVSVKSLQENHVTNRFNLDTNEIIVNGHKFNSNLWEYTDFKSFEDVYGETHAVGKFNLMGTALVRSWDHTLHKYMLIRRLIRMPMFYDKCNVPEILEELKIEDPYKKTFKYHNKQLTVSAKKWYEQVGKEFDDTQYAERNYEILSGGGDLDSVGSPVIGTSINPSDIKVAENVGAISSGLQFSSNMSERTVKPTIISIHHSAGSSNDTVENMHEYHKTKGWAGLGYNFVIEANGSVKEGRPMKYIPAAVEHHNAKMIGICLPGNFEETEPTSAQINALTSFLIKLCREYNIPCDRQHIKGHKEFSGHELNNCPGKNLFSKLDSIVAAAGSNNSIRVLKDS